MLKKLFVALAVAAGLALAPVMFAGSAVAQDAAMQADIEALVLQYAEDEAALEAAITEYVAGATDPEAATQAVIAALTNPQNPAVATALAGDADLKSAVGRGLGAAIALVGVTNPSSAANMLAMVEATGDTTLIASVNEGEQERTASIRSGGVDTGEEALNEEGDSTPEEPASGS